MATLCLTQEDIAPRRSRLTRFVLGLWGLWVFPSLLLLTLGLGGMGGWLLKESWDDSGQPTECLPCDDAATPMLPVPLLGSVDN